MLHWDETTRRSMLTVAAAASVISVFVGSFAWADELPNPIKIGHLSSMTGGAATVGQNGHIGVQLAIRVLNERGGIRGSRVELVLADDQSDPTAAVNEARRLALREGVHAVAGPYLSQLVLATAPVFTQSKILSTSTASSSAVTVDIAPYHFSVAPDVYGQAEVMIGYASDTLKVGKVSILHDNGALGKAGRQALEETSKAKGLEVSGVQEFQYRASDVTPQLLALRRSESEALVIWPTVGEDAGLIQKNLAELGWDIPVIGATSVSGQAPAAVKIAGPDAFKNTVAADYGGFTYCKGDPVGVSPFAKLMETVKADGHDLDKVATQTISLGYDMVMVLAVAIENTESVDGSVLAKWIEANSEKLPYTAVTAYTASPGQHFMTGPKGMGIVVNSDKPREDLLRERITNCEG